jgi:hypothetical protein
MVERAATGTTGRQAPFLGRKQATHGVYIEMVVLAVIIALEGKRSSDGDILPAAKWAGVTVIGLYALLATRGTGLSLLTSVVTASFFTLIGLGLVLFKQYFH